MDEIALFRDIVSGHCIPPVSSRDRIFRDFNFKFETVCYRSKYAYCLCFCGYEHEYLTYISNSGEIDNEIYERVVQNIQAGKCPHVDVVPKDYVKTTSINAMHIIVAVNKDLTLEKLCQKIEGPVNRNLTLEELYQKMRQDFTVGIPGQLSGLTPYHIAIIKNNVSVLSMLPCKLKRIPQIMYYAEKLDDKLRIEHISTLRLCSKQNNPDLVSCHVSHWTNMARLHDFFYWHICDAMKCNISNINIHKLLTKARTCGSFPSAMIIFHHAIIWNNPSVLADTVADVISRANYDNPEYFTKLCIVLQRQACLEVLISHNFEVPQFPDTDRIDFLLDLLISYDAAEIVEQDIPVLNRLTDATETSKSSMDQKKSQRTHLYKYNDSFLPRDVSVLKVLKVLLQVCDVNNVVNQYEITPFVHLLGKSGMQANYPNQLLFRQTVELYIYENPDLAVNTTAVKHAMDLDKETYSNSNDEHYFTRSTFGEFEHPLPLTADGKRHALFGHDGSFHLNFYAPLLIESGYPFFDISSDFQESLENVHPLEKAYLQNCFNVPRSLKLCCRDSLRKHFKGRQIHWFVEKSTLPSSVSDYLLLKPLLRCIPKAMLD